MSKKNNKEGEYRIVKVPTELSFKSRIENYNNAIDDLPDVHKNALINNQKIILDNDSNLPNKKNKLTFSQLSKNISLK